MHFIICWYYFPDSAAVAQLAVNQLVVGSNPTPGAKHKKREKLFFILAFNFKNMTLEERKKIDCLVDSFIRWIGSFVSLAIHTFLFLACLTTGLLWGHWDSILLVLTTIVSLEAIYLSIFIQMSINRNTESLQAVEKDIDEIQEDVEDIAEDVDEIAEDVEDIAEDVEELSEEGAQEESQEEQDRRLLKDIQDNMIKITADLEQLKKNR